ncbi:MAG TPA: hypothetical protein VMM37_02995, partial [Bacteroidota bacterium]|nr:hypothetical protein [Bacteroidota bacterium]
MKTFAMVAAGLMVVSYSVVGQPVKNEEKSGTLENGTVYSIEFSSHRGAALNYAVALRSDCDGVVESAIAYSTLLRLVAQDLDMGRIQKILVDLSENGRTHAIRYKAYLALAVFENPAKFQNAA